VQIYQKEKMKYKDPLLLQRMLGFKQYHRTKLIEF